jgi:membrane-bound serine protease (ClpP class)
VVLGALLAVAGPAHAQPEPTRHVDVIEVNGLIDDVLVDFVNDALTASQRGRAAALVLQVDSTGGVAARSRIDRLISRVRHAPVPVTVWIGGSGRPRAYRDAFRLARAAAVVGVAPGARLGEEPPGVTGTEALRRGLADVNAPTLGDFLVELDGRPWAGGRIEVPNEVVRRAGHPPQRRPLVDVRFAKPGLTARLLHGVAGPSVAYLLLVVGLLLLVFEFFTAGVGVAGAVAVAVLVLASYGLGELPTRLSAVALVVIGILASSIDVQAGAPRTWTVIGILALAVGSVRLYDGLTVPLWVMAAVLAATAVAMVSGMPAMVRARFSTPTIGRESMVGDMGVAIDQVAPEGRVEVRGAPWRARTNRATPIAAGEVIRVVGIDGLLLEVEPEAGGARDYRH